jgi:hypothetical protein
MFLEEADFMVLKISIDKQKCCSIFTLIGDISFFDLRSELEFYYNRSSALHRMPMIWDFRQADLSKTHRQQIDKIAAFFDQELYLLDTIRVACIVDNDLQYGLCRILQFYMDKNVVEIKTFKDYCAAIEWISN